MCRRADGRPVRTHRSLEFSVDAWILFRTWLSLGTGYPGRVRAWRTGGLPKNYPTDLTSTASLSSTPSNSAFAFCRPISKASRTNTIWAPSPSPRRLHFRDGRRRGQNRSSGLWRRAHAELGANVVHTLGRKLDPRLTAATTTSLADISRGILLTKSTNEVFTPVFEVFTAARILAGFAAALNVFDAVLLVAWVAVLGLRLMGSKARERRPRALRTSPEENVNPASLAFSITSATDNVMGSDRMKSERAPCSPSGFGPSVLLAVLRPDGFLGAAIALLGFRLLLSFLFAAGLALRA